jgi:hypothetical protein
MGPATIGHPRAWLTSLALVVGGRDPHCGAAKLVGHGEGVSRVILAALLPWRRENA